MSAAGTARKGAGAPAPVKIYGFCWFRREHYDASRAMMIDPQDLFETYDEWLHEAKAIEAKATADGIRVMRIRFDPAGFAMFCMVNNLKPDNHARAAWAAQEAKRRTEAKAD